MMTERNVASARRRLLAPGARSGGVALVDTLIASPLVIWLGMAVLQWALVFHARYAVSYALLEAGRSGSVNYAEASAIDQGLARGLVPYLYGASDAAEFLANLARARAHIEVGRAAGWIELRQLSPTDQSFADWGVTARDDEGRAMSGQLEIPIDSLRYRAVSSQPATGTAGRRGDEPIGAASGQTLSDANLLKLELTYGVPMTVPLVGSLATWVMRQLDGCAAPAGKRLALVDLGTPTPQPRDWTCPFYDAVDEQGARKPRWPVKMSVIVRMQSPARHAGVESGLGAEFGAAARGGSLAAAEARNGTGAGVVDDSRGAAQGRIVAATAGSAGDSDNNDALNRLPLPGGVSVAPNRDSLLNRGEVAPLGVCRLGRGSNG